MKSLNFKKNTRTYCINDDENVTVEINTSDYGIFQRAKESEAIFRDLDEQRKEAKLSGRADIITYMSELDKKVRQQLNYIFGTDVSTPAFGSMNCFSLVDGVPVFVGFLNALMGEIKNDMQASADKASKNIGKYVNQIKK